MFLALGGEQQVKMADIASLPELNPPHVMPQGNVGTPLSTFMDLIQACKFPSQLIKKLQLKFPNSRSGKKYGAVPFEYESQQAFSKDSYLSLSELETKKAKRKHLDSRKHDFIPSNTTVTTVRNCPFHRVKIAIAIGLFLPKLVLSKAHKKSLVLFRLSLTLHVYNMK